MLSSNKNKLDESMMFHRGVAGGPLILEIYLVNHQFTVFFLPTIAPHPRAGAPTPLMFHFQSGMKQRVASM